MQGLGDRTNNRLDEISRDFHRSCQMIINKVLEIQQSEKQLGKESIQEPMR